MTLKPDQLLGGFAIVKMIGRGSMGQVYRARDTKLGREVALKVLPKEFAASGEFLQRFIREARVLASLNHPSIASLYDFHQVDGLSFLVMELVEGETLSQRLRKGPLPLGELLPAFIQVAEGLANAHGKGVIHRDLKPGNLKFASDGHLKVIDFGIARSLPAPQAVPDPEEEEENLTRVGGVIGTPAYMSPEQACGDELDARTDIWSYGCCLFEALTGERLFQGRHSVDLVASIVSESPQWRRIPQNTPSDLRNLIVRCLAREPGERLSTIAEARDVLKRLLNRTEPGTGSQRIVRARPSRFQAIAAIDLGRPLPPSDSDDGVESFAGMVDAMKRKFEGNELAIAGPRHLLVFETPSQAVLFSLSLQHRLAGSQPSHAFEAHIGIHAGEFQSDGEEEAELDREKATGAVRHALELLELAAPRQILLTEGAFRTSRERLESTRFAERTVWLDHGSYEFPGLKLVSRVFEVGLSGVSRLKPPESVFEARLKTANRPLSMTPISRKRS